VITGIELSEISGHFAVATGINPTLDHFGIRCSNAADA
jgi:hypothetical protein